MKRRRLLLLPLLLCSIGLAACDTLGYYRQAVGGQFQLLGQRQKIDVLLQSDSTSPELKARLRSVQDILAFARDELELPADGQYTTYVELDRPFVVWNVFATPEFSLQPLTWCYPIAGCVTYRGWFSETNAVKHARKLEAEGYDVYLGGVAAYSTLGWFSDPVLSTLVQRPEHRLAMLLFHELAHQKFYLPGDTEFNESFATAVEQFGLEQWLVSRAGSEQAALLLAGLAQEQARRAEFLALVQSAATDLDILYQSGADSTALRKGKADRMAALRMEYQSLKATWGGDAAYDAWFAQEINNAQLATVATYNSYVPAFKALFDHCAAQWPCFYAQLQELAKVPATERRARLAAVLEFPILFPDR